jgi:hypothetical protein
MLLFELFDGDEIIGNWLLRSLLGRFFRYVTAFAWLAETHGARVTIDDVYRMLNRVD